MSESRDLISLSNSQKIRREKTVQLNWFKLKKKVWVKVGGQTFNLIINNLVIGGNIDFTSKLPVIQFNCEDILSTYSAYPSHAHIR